METVKIVCTCVPGFESVTIKECGEKFNINATSEFRGRVSFPMKICDTTRVQELRSVSHYWVLVSEHPGYFADYETNEELFANLKDLPNQISWENALKTWKLFKMHVYNKAVHVESNRKMNEKDGIVEDVEANDKLGDNGSNINGKEASEQLAVNETCATEIEQKLDEKEPKCVENKSKKPKLVDYTNVDPLTAGEEIAFRVTANRTGKNHTFTSVETAIHLGAGVNESIGWRVDLTNYDVEVVIHAVEKDFSVGIQLTTENQSHRNIRHFGPTTLKANISYSLLQFANVSPGDIVCDPMCGSGSISLEGALGCADMFQLAGENHPVAVEHTGENIEGCEQERGENFSLPVNVVQWDIYQLPLRTSSVDRIVTDLPFGKKHGNKDRNMFLYPVALREMGRICRPQGMAVLMTQHKGALANALKRVSLWKQVEIRKIFMGGMNLVVYLLRRTKEKYVGKSNEKPSEGKEKSNSSISDENDVQKNIS